MRRARCSSVQASTEETPQCSTKRVVSAPVTPQITIQDSLAKAIPLPHNSERYKKLTKAVCYFICKDQQPFDTINDSGFRHMLRVFEPHYTPPDRKTIALNHIPTMYDAVKADSYNTSSQCSRNFQNILLVVTTLFRDKC